MLFSLRSGCELLSPTPFSFRKIMGSPQTRTTNKDFAKKSRLKLRSHGNEKEIKQSHKMYINICLQIWIDID